MWLHSKRLGEREKSDSRFNRGMEEEEGCLPLPSAPESGLGIRGWGLVRNGHSWAPPQMCEFGAQQPVFQQAFWGLLIHSEVGEARASTRTACTSKPATELRGILWRV